VVTSNNSDAKDVLLIIKLFQPLSTCCGRKARFHIHFSNTSNAKVSLHDASANKWFILLGLIKSSNQRPHLGRETTGVYISENSFFPIHAIITYTYFFNFMTLKLHRKSIKRTKLVDNLVKVKNFTHYSMYENKSAIKQTIKGHYVISNGQRSLITCRVKCTPSKIFKFPSFSSY